jgi:hypothetical protein
MGEAHACESSCRGATFDAAVEDLTLGGPYDLVLCDGRSEGCEGFRARLRESAPDVLSRTFDIALPGRGADPLLLRGS